MNFSLRSISWKYKLGLVSAIPFLVGISMGGLSSYIIYNQSSILKSQVESSIERQTIISSARVAIVDFERAVQAVIAAETASDIRNNSITVIRASSIIDESLQNLKRARPEDSNIDSLQTLLLNIQPSQIHIIKHATKNQDTDALNEVDIIKDDINQVNLLAKQVLNDELEELQHSIHVYYDRVSSISYSMQLILLLCFGTGFYLFRRLVQLLLTPLSNMTAQVAAISEGKLESRVKVTSTDELGALGDDFNNMACKLSDLFDELEKSRDKALRAEKIKSQFLANMSHEIRTPMNAIIGFTSLMLHQDMEEKHKKHIRFIDNASHSLLRLINEILDLTKLNSDSMDVEIIEFNLEQLLDDEIMAFSVLSNERNIELILSLDTDVPHKIFGDPNRVKQILSNLLGNAIKFTKQGEVELSVSLTNRTDRDVSITFSLRDTGTGIAAEYLPLLFDYFTQEDASTARKFGGSGLGLSIVKKLVNLLGGDIWVDTVVDQGSTFSFTLPFTMATEEIVRPSRTQQKTIASLVINHSKASGVSLTRYLNSWQVETTVTTSIAGALKILQENTFDLLLVDENVVDDPASNLAALHKVQPNHPTVILYACFFQLAPRIEPGILTLLDKPVKSSQLRTSIDSIRTGTLIKTPVEKHLQRPVTKAPIRPARKNRILVVDDIEANQVLAVEMLEAFGIDVEVTNNGKSAVEVVCKGHFDLILMDINMPIMNGLEATALIRKDIRFKKLPIIALTANAMVGFKKECREAGMNDYLSKPFDMDQLQIILKQWLEPALEIGSSNDGADEKGKGDEFDDDQYQALLGFPDSLPGIDIVSGIRRWQGNKELYFKQVHYFCQDYADSSVKLNQLFKASSYEELRLIAHAIKGRAGNLSLPEAFRSTEAIEDAIDKSLPLEKSLLDAFDDALTIIIDSEKSLYAVFENVKQSDISTLMAIETAANQDEPVSMISDIATDIKLLFKLLEQSNIESKDTFNKLKPNLEKCKGIGKQLGELDFALNCYSFDDAHAHLLDIIRKIDISLESLS